MKNRDKIQRARKKCLKNPNRWHIKRREIQEQYN